MNYAAYVYGIMPVRWSVGRIRTAQIALYTVSSPTFGADFACHLESVCIYLT